MGNMGNMDQGAVIGAPGQSLGAQGAQGQPKRKLQKGENELLEQVKG